MGVFLHVSVSKSEPFEDFFSNPGFDFFKTFVIHARCDKNV